MRERVTYIDTTHLKRYYPNTICHLRTKNFILTALFKFIILPLFRRKRECPSSHTLYKQLWYRWFCLSIFLTSFDFFKIFPSYYPIIYLHFNPSLFEFIKRAQLSTWPWEARHLPRVFLFPSLFLARLFRFCLAPARSRGVLRI